jgi:hypothetical protein
MNMTRIELKEGDLVGFKAAPGRDCDRLFAHVRNENEGGKGKGCCKEDWSGIYVQLDIAQAIRYVPNQYERNEEMSCIVSLRVKKGVHSLNVIICNDKKMADVTISSTEKADIVREYLNTNGYTDVAMKTKPLLSALGDYGVALLLLDSEDYELAIPHILFNENVLEAETIFVLPQSMRRPCTIGSVQAVQPDIGTDASLQTMLNRISKNELCDAGELSVVLSKAMQEANLPTRVSWFLE